MENQMLPNENKSRTFKNFANIGLLLLIAFSSGWYLGRRGFVANFEFSSSPLEVVQKTPAGTDQSPADFGLFWQVWDKVTSSYLRRPLNGKDLVYGATKGMVAGVGDPYTVFLDPEEKDLLDSGLNGRYEGVGIELAIRDEQLMIISPLDGSPAKKAGVLAGDKLLEIDGTSAVGITIVKAVSSIRGKAGTTVRLTLQSEGDDPRTLTIVRSKITAPSVNWESVDNGIMYVRVSRFGLDTNREWDSLHSKFAKIGAEPKVIILDLRGNPGGYLEGAVHLASDFVKRGAIVIEDRGNGKQKEYKASGEASFSEVKVVLLIDKGSASSSEILAAALQYYINAVLVGQPSFGKGTIQEAVNLPEGAGLHITVARWLTPSGEWLDGKGLQPDHLVERTGEDLTRGEDPQLDKAKELAREMLSNS